MYLILTVRNSRLVNNDKLERLVAFAEPVPVKSTFKMLMHGYKETLEGISSTTA